MENEREQQDAEDGAHRLDKGDNKKDEGGKPTLLEAAAAEDLEREGNDGNGPEDTLEGVIGVAAIIVDEPVQDIALALVEEVDDVLAVSHVGNDPHEVAGGNARGDDDRGPRVLIDDEIATHVLAPPLLELGDGAEEVEDPDQDVGEPDHSEQRTEGDDDDAEDAEAGEAFTISSVFDRLSVHFFFTYLKKTIYYLIVNKYL